MAKTVTGIIQNFDYAHYRNSIKMVKKEHNGLQNSFKHNFSMPDYLPSNIQPYR